MIADVWGFFIKTMEKWKSVIGFENYQVSNFGNVRNLKFISVNDIVNSKNLTLSTTTKGYFRVTLYGKTRRHFQVHRLVAIAFIPNPDNKREVNHKDGDKTNNNDWNLEWNTPKENVIHAWDNGLNHALKGEENGFSKLTTDNVIEIRNSQMTGVFLSKKFNVSCAHISRIKLNQVWKHI